MTTTDQIANEHDRDPEAQTGAAAAESGLPELFAAVSLELGPDPESQEFAEGLQQLRPLYEHRQTFNFMVCDQLALRGLPPNGKNVLTAGRWGTASAVAADVRAWYTGLAARLTADHARIPEALKRGANSLLEQMWNMVLEAYTGPANARIRDLEGQLQATRAELEQARTAAEEAREDARAARADRERIEGELKSQLALANDDVARMRAEIARLQASIAEAAMQHERDRKELDQLHRERVEAIERTHAEVIARHLSDLANLQSSLQRERERNEEQNKAHALAIDGFRQDVRDALRRADQAHAQMAQEKARADAKSDDLSQAEIRAARLEMRMSELRNESTMAEVACEALRSEVESLRQRCAAAEAELDAMKASKISGDGQNSQADHPAQHIEGKSK